MKKLKENKGFTLVELIVVIAILGILAAVAVPAYSGYVEKANKAADLQTLDAIKTAVTVAAAEKSVAVDNVTVTKSDSDYSIVINKTNNNGTLSGSGTTLGTNTSPTLAAVKTYLSGVTFTEKFSSAVWIAGGQWAVTMSAS